MRFCSACVADVRHEVGRDQVFLRGPAQHRAEPLQQAVAGDHGIGLDHGIAGCAQVGLGELIRRQRQVGRKVEPEQPHRLVERLDLPAFPFAQLPRTVEQVAEREDVGRARMWGWGLGRRRPLSARSITRRAASRAAASSIAGKWPSGLRG